MEKYTSFVHQETKVSSTAKKIIGGLSIALVASFLVIGYLSVNGGSSQTLLTPANFITTSDDLLELSAPISLAPSGTIPIYRYHVVNSDGTGWRFLFSTSSNVGQGWTLDGVDFYAYANAVYTGTPLYQYHNILSNGSGWSFLYSLSSSVSGWTFDSAICYAFAYQATGTSPYYAYYAYNADGTIRFLYSRVWGVANGWTYYNIAFYAY